MTRGQIKEHVEKMLAADVMTHDVVTVSPEADVQDIAQAMLARKISAIPVVDQNNALMGIVSEGDLMRRSESGTERTRSWWLRLFGDKTDITRDFIKSHGRHARDIMTKNVIAVSEETPITEIADILESNHIKRVPIVRDGKVVGIVSRANLLRGLATFVPAKTVPESDRSIRAAVLDAIASAGVDHHFIDAIVKDGTVQLWGAVFTEEERQAAKVAAEGVSGVTKIDNHVAVVPETVGSTGWV